MKNFFILFAGLTCLTILFITCETEKFDTIPTGDEMTVIEGNNYTTDTNIQGINNGCTTIQSGELVDSDGETLTTGYNEWGYNYQARKFNGYYCDAYKNAAWCQPYVDVSLSMKWNDAWISNQDCDGDGLLDRHFGFDTYRGSGAWLTNHQSGTYTNEDGEECHWNYFVKIVAAPMDAYAEGGIFYNSDGTEIGPQIWGDFAIIQQVENDPCAGIHGLQYVSPDHAGLGNW